MNTDLTIDIFQIMEKNKGRDLAFLATTNLPSKIPNLEMSSFFKKICLKGMCQELMMLILYFLF